MKYQRLQSVSSSEGHVLASLTAVCCGTNVASPVFFASSPWALRTAARLKAPESVSPTIKNLNVLEMIISIILQVLRIATGVPFAGKDESCPGFMGFSGRNERGRRGRNPKNRYGRVTKRHRRGVTFRGGGRL